MKVSLKKAFNLLDGRLSTSMDDIYEMFNYIFTENFFTHQLPRAMDMLKEKNPQWFSNGVKLLDKIKQEENTNDFQQLMKIIDEKYLETEIELEKI